MVLTTEKPEVAPRGAASRPGAVKLPKKKRAAGWWLPFALIAPAIVFELLIHVIPMAVGIWMSFLKLTQFYIANWGAAPFVGLGNYQIALNFNGAQGQALLSSFVVTCGYTILVVGIAWALGMAAAVALQKTFRGRAIFRTMFLIPYAVPVFAGIITWKFMFQQNTGVINQILGALHLIDPNNPPFWLIGNNAFAAMVIVAIWKLWPFAFLMLMAGLQTINEDLYEAASLDGAKPFRQWRNITLPGLGAVNNVLLLVLFLWTFNDFNTPFILFGGAEPPAGDLVSFHIYNTSFITLNFGFGSAMSVLLLLFLMLVSAIYLAFINRRSRRA
ncbi:carbohydrate ABC transporter permease [Subtercola lobariae]|uniref:ABC transporter permease n=1 Tax=Subtercola lobariae TaxID=1588641 RepID=A0A917B4A8_9MICO|nr:sugar ABC transporter permease [Subtercola lobariae]GGF20903.1 ABC transporter permease [Subtercola lobariae]